MSKDNPTVGCITFGNAHVADPVARVLDTFAQAGVDAAKAEAKRQDGVRVRAFMGIDGRWAAYQPKPTDPPANATLIMDK